jgi:hypothetical protein
MNDQLFNVSNGLGGLKFLPAFQAPTGIYEKFLEYHKKNPHIFEELMRLADDLWRKGRKRIGLQLLFEVCRYNSMIRAEDPNSQFKINNNYAAHYARLMLNQRPEWNTFIEIREIRSV